MVKPAYSASTRFPPGKVTIMVDIGVLSRQTTPRSF
jgi:hypothetical protein